MMLSGSKRERSHWHDASSKYALFSYAALRHCMAQSKRRKASLKFSGGLFLRQMPKPEQDDTPLRCLFSDKSKNWLWNGKLNEAVSPFYGMVTIFSLYSANFGSSAKKKCLCA
jgi:hypothetical protein